MINYNIDVYLRHTEMENMYVRELIELVTNDYNGNVFNFTIYDTDQKVYDLTSKTLSLIVKSELGTVIEDNCTIINATGGSAKIILPSDMFCEKGTYYAELQIWEGLNRITSLPFDYTVRLSMDSNEAVRADNRFSLLQQALKDVSDSNVIAAEAKTTAESALAKSNQAVTTIDSQVSKVNTAASSANTALDRATSVVTQEELANKIGHNGIFDDTNFNFIESKVVNGNGIKTNNPTTLQVETSNIKRIVFKGLYNGFKRVGADRLVECNGFIVGVDSSGYAYITGKGNAYVGLGMLYANTIKEIELDIRIDETKAIVLWNDRIKEVALDTPISSDRVQILTQETCECIAIASLTGDTQEIQHNFSVLNNAPSINALETGSKKLLLASDTDHVTDRTGRTQQAINQVFYEQFGKEFVADSAGKISVNNGLEGWVNRAEIQGQTVKDFNSYLNQITMAPSIRQVMINRFNLDTSKTYSFIVEATRIVGTPIVQLSTTGIGLVPSRIQLKLGINKIVFTPNYSDIVAVQLATTSSSDAECDFKIIGVFDGDVNVSSQLPFGLNSTQAIISNNGNQHCIYEPQITGKTRILNGSGVEVDTGLVPIDPLLPPLKDGDVLDLVTKTITFANKTTKVLTNEEVKAYRNLKKLISLPSAEDKVILNEDGSGSYIQDKFRYIFNDTDSWKMDSRTPLQNTLLFHIILANLSSNKNNLNAIPNVLNPNLMYSVDAEGIYTDSGILYVRVLKSKLPSQDLLGFKEWAQSVNFYVWLQLAAPITTYIPKEITPTILTNKINILEVDSPVAPSSFKATLPINKNAEQDAEIQNLKDRLNTVMNVLYANPLLVNTYIDQEVQESQKAINERMM